jgi:hypothetical protein
MTKVWLKSRAKWKETHADEPVDPNADKEGLDTPKDKLRRLLSAQTPAKASGDSSS